MSKRASLTLRKPGQGTSPKAIEAFIDGSGDDMDANVDITPLQPARHPQATTTPTKTTPEIKPNPTALTSAKSVEVPTFRRASRSIAKRKTKPDRRRTTVYMELSIARELAAHCATNDLDMSDAVNAALSTYLARQ